MDPLRCSPKAPIRPGVHLRTDRADCPFPLPTRPIPYCEQRCIARTDASLFIFVFGGDGAVCSTVRRLTAD